MSATETTTQTVVTGIDIAVYLTRDPERSIAFYRDVLGIAPTEVDDGGRGAEFTLGDGSTFGVWRPDDGPQTGATIMFAVDDIVRAVPAMRARGAKLSDVFETPACFMSDGVDPDGNTFIVHQRKRSTTHP